MNIRSLLLVVMVPLFLVLGACSGTQTFSTAARAGDTVTLMVGWQKTLQRQNLTVTITDVNNISTTYHPSDSNYPVRGIVNLYPDPASRVVVGTMTKQDLNVGAQNTGSQINSYVTNQSSTGEHDNEWWQTSIVFDLPPSLPAGAATITLVDTSTNTTLKPINVTVLPGTGARNLFNIYNMVGNPTDYLSVNPNGLIGFERAPRYTVTFASSTTDSNGVTIKPHAIQMVLSHTPGVGKTWIVNPRGDIKNVVWHDDGSNIMVMLTPTQGITLKQMLDYKFYVSGGVTALAQTSLKAYDINGVAMTGITAAIQ